MQQTIKVLCTKADRGGLVIEAVLQEIDFLGERPNVEVEVIEIDSPSFCLTEARVDQWVEQRAIVIPLVTPMLLRNANMQQIAVSGSTTDSTSQLVSRSSLEGMMVLPVYCLPVENPDACCFASLIWTCGNTPRNRKPFPARRGQRLDALEVLAKELRCVLDDQSSPQSAQPLDLAIICAPAEQPKVGPAMDLLLPWLRHNGKHYRFIGSSAGTTIEKEVEAASSARHLLVFISTESMILDYLWEVIPKIQPDQKVTFVVLGACRYGFLNDRMPQTLSVPPTWLPTVKGEVVTLQGSMQYKGFFQVLQHLTDQLLDGKPT